MPIKKRFLLVERERAATLILISVVSFATTVALVRLFLELTGYPQVGGGALHIAHLLWGGLAMFIGLIIVLIWDNPGALTVTALLSGVGIGLFMDEVGKFITKTNDYFFPAAAPIVYGFFLVVLLVYLFVRRRRKPDPRRAMVMALDELKEIVYGEVDEVEGQRILDNLSLARQNDDPHVAAIAASLYDQFASQREAFAAYRPGLFKRMSHTLKRWGLKLGQKWHRRLIILGLIMNAISALALLVIVLLFLFSPDTSQVVEQLSTGLVEAATAADAGGVAGQIIHGLLNVVIGLAALVAIIQLWRGKERSGMNWALVQIILALTLLQMVTFYLNQFTAIISSIGQFIMLGLIIAYQRWYLNQSDEQANDKTMASA